MIARPTPLFAAALVLITSLPHLATGGSGGTYRGTAAESMLTVTGDTPLALGAIAIKIKLPRRRGRIKGTLFTTRILPPATPAAADVPISGRIKRSRSRAGGKARLLTGVTVLDFTGTGLAATSPATGKLSLRVKSAGGAYTLKTKPGLSVTGPGPPPFSFTGSVSAKK